MRLIVGLGNPGKQYSDSRHNVGFMVVDLVAQHFSSHSSWDSIKKPALEFIKLPSLILAKPYTYMNLSGEAVSYLMRRYKVKSADLWVIYDDLDIPFGSLKINRGGGSAGHHGVESIIEKTGTSDFVRFRVGIGEIGEGVLQSFSKEEAVVLTGVINKARDAVVYACDLGIEKAMNEYNESIEQNNK